MSEECEKLEYVVTDGSGTTSPPVLLKEVSNHGVCQECPGYCCHRFWLKHTKKEMKIMLMLGKDCKLDKHDRYSVEFALKYFRRLPRLDKPECVNWYNRAYTCKKFDHKLGRCGAYKRRPLLCKLYLCEIAHQGGDPTDAVPAGMVDAGEWGKRVINRRVKKKSH
jgi:Fe-S-cluster containining protein